MFTRFKSYLQCMNTVLLLCKKQPLTRLPQFSKDDSFWWTDLIWELIKPPHRSRPLITSFSSVLQCCAQKETWEQGPALLAPAPSSPGATPGKLPQSHTLVCSRGVWASHFSADLLKIHFTRQFHGHQTSAAAAGLCLAKSTASAGWTCECRSTAAWTRWPPINGKAGPWQS